MPAPREPPPGSSSPPAVEWPESRPWARPSPTPVVAALKAPNPFASRDATSAKTLDGESFIGMLELPETETMARDLDREIAGRTIEKVSVRRPDVLREVD